MTARRPYKRADEETRRADLIRATLDCIAEGGPEAATVRAIALKAGVTPGLIRHYFATKEDLVAAAHKTLMTRLTEASLARLDDLPEDPLARLSGFVANAVAPPVVDARAMALWAASVQLVPRDAAMRDVHEETYLAFRDRLQTMIADALRCAGKDADAARTRTLAILGNALLDGLWIEASLLPQQFQPGELRRMTIMAFSRLLDLSLPE